MLVSQYLKTTPVCFCALRLLHTMKLNLVEGVNFTASSTVCVIFEQTNAILRFAVTANREIEPRRGGELYRKKYGMNIFDL